MFSCPECGKDHPAIRLHHVSRRDLVGRQLEELTAMTIGEFETAYPDYTVIVNNGGTVEIFNGTFTGAGDRGGRGSGVLITTFERTAGPAATGQRSVSPPEVGPTSKR